MPARSCCSGNSSLVQKKPRASLSKRLRKRFKSQRKSHNQLFIAGALGLPSIRTSEGRFKTPVNMTSLSAYLSGKSPVVKTKEPRATLRKKLLKLFFKKKPETCAFVQNTTSLPKVKYVDISYESTTELAALGLHDQAFLEDSDASSSEIWDLSSLEQLNPTSTESPAGSEAVYAVLNPVDPFKKTSNKNISVYNVRDPLGQLNKTFIIKSNEGSEAVYEEMNPVRKLNTTFTISPPNSDAVHKAQLNKTFTKNTHGSDAAS
ncbi:uncharacterized protein LOC106011995 [Aplysia californica]|uniref:Uncharacterized protein LOC106011995 n=1 Tax=Aplysia californica TaxID=6500 RepID=A0ABM1A1I1_APLCA|nr:uncharacterized protein LOC106011995 [Aplysia californica]